MSWRHFFLQLLDGRVRLGRSTGVLLALLMQQPGNQVRERLKVNWLREIRVYAGPLAFGSLAGHRIGRQRNNRNAARRTCHFADAPRCSHSVHFRHLYIHKYDVKNCAFTQRLDGVRRRSKARHMMPRRRQPGLDQCPVHLDIVDNHDP